MNYLYLLGSAFGFCFPAFCAELADLNRWLQKNFVSRPDSRVGWTNLSVHHFSAIPGNVSDTLELGRQFGKAI
jgi:hypothetical protein